MKKFNPNGCHSNILLIILSGLLMVTVCLLLFIILINDPIDCVSHSSVRFFADDKIISSKGDVKLSQKRKI